MKLDSASLTAIVAPPDAAVATIASEAQLRAIQDGIRATVEQGNATMRLIHELCGPNPVGEAAQLLGNFNAACGQFRAADAALCALWRLRNAQRRDE